MPKVMAKGRADIISDRGEDHASPNRLHATSAGEGGAVRISHHSARTHPVSAPRRNAAVNAVAEVEPCHTKAA